ncbi:MAG: AraC family transcriptional regulator [Phycisphaerae bacterium]
MTLTRSLARARSRAEVPTGTSAGRARTPTAVAHLPALSPELELYAGHETRHDTSYRWHGLRRGVRRPMAVLQYTLDGEGLFETPAGGRRLLPGSLFVALVPSDHCYSLPPTSGRWGFFWVIVHHAYVLQRLEQAVARAGCVWDVPPNAGLVTAMRVLYAAALEHDPDPTTRERHLFELVLQADRHLASVPERAEARRLLALVRRETMNALAGSGAVTGGGSGTSAAAPDVAALAAAAGEPSRSAFSHRFRRLTGQTPAAYARQLRLQAARRLLQTTDAPLKSVAGRCGFADANHLCKAFARTYGTSPAAWRALVRPG